jgi:ribosomal-protein-alanine N-acetyltransferase
MSPAFIRASLDGRRGAAEALGAFSLPEDWPDDGARRRLELRLDQLERRPGLQPWLLRAIVPRDEGALAGYINFHGAPAANGEAELGYTVLAPYRRRGLAFEAAQALINWAAAEHGLKRFVLSISPDNPASLGLAAKLGFAETGSQIDEEDGLELIFRLVMPNSRGR